VSIQNNAFSQSSVQVTSGGMVTWKNNDNEDHTVTANDGSFESGHITPGSTYSKVFTTTGTYLYHCSLHPEMTGTVVVVATSSGGGGGGY
jgi:plastocyanin